MMNYLSIYYYYYYYLLFSLSIICDLITCLLVNDNIMDMIVWSYKKSIL